MNSSIFPLNVDISQGTMAGAINDAYMDLDMRIKETQYMIEFLIQKGLIDKNELLDFISSRRLAERMSIDG